MLATSLFPAASPVSGSLFMHFMRLARDHALFAVGTDLYRTLTAAGATGHEIDDAFDELEKSGADLPFFPALETVPTLSDKPLFTCALDLMMLRTLRDRLVRGGPIARNVAGEVIVDEKTTVSETDVSRMIDHALYFEDHMTTLSANLMNEVKAFCKQIGSESPKLPPYPTVYEFTANTDHEALARVRRYLSEAGLPHSEDKTAGVLYTAGFTVSDFALGKLLADIAASEPGLTVSMSSKAYADLPMTITSFAHNMPGIYRARQLRHNLSRDGHMRPYSTWLSTRKAD